MGLGQNRRKISKGKAQEAYTHGDTHVHIHRNSSKNTKEDAVTEQCETGTSKSHGVHFLLAVYC